MSGERCARSVAERAARVKQNWGRIQPLDEFSAMDRFAGWLPTVLAPNALLARSLYLIRSCANASIVVGPWNFSVPGLPKWIQPELKLFTISM